MGRCGCWIRSTGGCWSGGDPVVVVDAESADFKQIEHIALRLAPTGGTGVRFSLLHAAFGDVITGSAHRPRRQALPARLIPEHGRANQPLPAQRHSLAGSPRPALLGCRYVFCAVSIVR